MGRELASSTTLWRPQGYGWAKFRKGLWRRWAEAGKLACFACGHPVGGMAAGEVEHRISAKLRPGLAWTEFWQGQPFLVPVHGSGAKRCPDCGLACNAVIGSNAARRDELGRSLPLTPAEIRAAQARTTGRPRSSAGKDRRDRPGVQSGQGNWTPAGRGTPATAGREWLRWRRSHQEHLVRPGPGVAAAEPGERGQRPGSRRIPGNMSAGTVVIAGRAYQVTRLRLKHGMLIITARHDGPVPPCADEPAAVFGEDGQGVCQSWHVTLPADAAVCDFVTVELPIQITHLEAEPASSGCNSA